MGGAPGGDIGKALALGAGEVSVDVAKRAQLDVGGAQDRDGRTRGVEEDLALAHARQRLVAVRGVERGRCGLCASKDGSDELVAQRAGQAILAQGEAVEFGHGNSLNARSAPPEFGETLRGGRDYSHSMVPGGLEVQSKTTRLTSLTSLVIRVEIFSNTSYGRRVQSAVMASSEDTGRSTIGWP